MRLPKTPFSEKILDDYLDWLNEPGKPDDNLDSRFLKYVIWREVCQIAFERGKVWAWTS